MEERIRRLRQALEAILHEAENADAVTGHLSPEHVVVEIAGTARLALSFDDAEAAGSR